MMNCPKCSRTIDDTRFAAGYAICPSCGSSLDAATESHWIPIAKVASLAEAGFLSDELTGSGIEAEVHQSNDFSAVTVRWHASYVIRVRSDASDEAASKIREYMEESARDESLRTSTYSLLDGSAPSDSAFWKPVVLVLLAGVSSFVLGQRFTELRFRDVERRAASDHLAATLAEVDREFIAPAEDGRAGHRLQYSTENRLFVLDTDRDGDGRYDSRRAFHASGMRW